MRNSIAMSRRSLLRTLTGLVAWGVAAARALATPAESGLVAARHIRPDSLLRSRTPLAPQSLYALPLGSIKPTGWLLRQLQIQADGLGGRLDETWADVGPRSGWLGGDGESWERGPYFLDGLLPLAWLLESPVLKAKAQRFIDWTLDHPWPNGMIGPRGNDDWWPRMVMLKVLTQYHELTGDPRVIRVMSNYFRYQLTALPERPLKNWGRFRWQDEVVSILWLYNRTGERQLLALAELLRQQGFNWQRMFENFTFTEKVTPASIGLDQGGSGNHDNGLKDPALSVHGVNNAQALKASPLWSVVSGEQRDREAIHRQLAALDEYHGLANGMFSADEHLAGRSPSQGVELCAVVETLYSLELALAITGAASLGDRIEKIAYNALPAAFTDDMWAHQYDQQPNQVECSLHKRPWTTNGPESNLFGLEPHFGCCTANFHQGWPKLTASLWMAGPNQLTATIYAPCKVDTVIGNTRVQLEEVTDYPFRDRVSILVNPDNVRRFSIGLRIPAWSSATTIRVNDQAVDAGAPGSFAKLDREWRAGDRIDVEFHSVARLVPGYNGSVSVQQGALVYALPIGEAWIKLRQRGLTADWQVYPTTAWNYGVLPDNAIRRSEQPVGPVPFSIRNPPVTLTLNGRLVPAWKAEEGSADPVPVSPIPDEAAGEWAELALLPYGAPKLRVTSLPIVAAHT